MYHLLDIVIVSVQNYFKYIYDDNLFKTFEKYVPCIIYLLL
jgi:hypothetical protein